MTSGTDTLRIYVFLQNYRYATKTQISLDPKKYRYVGGIFTFETADLLQFNSEQIEIKYRLFLPT
jgi:hypothetical protein